MREQILIEAWRFKYKKCHDVCSGFISQNKVEAWFWYCIGKLNHHCTHQRAFVKIFNWIDGRFSSTQCLSVWFDLFHQISRYCNLIYGIEKINGFFFRSMDDGQAHGMLKTIRSIQKWPMIHFFCFSFLFFNTLFFLPFELNDRIGARYLFTLDLSGEWSESANHLTATQTSPFTCSYSVQ